MVISRGEIWWVDLGGAVGSEPGFRRPVLVVSADSFNRSRISTVVAVTISSNTALAGAPGNVGLPTEVSGLPRDSVVNVSQVVTVDKRRLDSKVGTCPLATMDDVDAGLALALGLVGPR